MPRNAEEEPRRRTFLGAAAAAAIGAAAAGCTADGSSRPHPGSPARGRPRASRTPARAAVAERDLPGDPDFWLRSAGPRDAIEGYAGQVSVRPGETFTLHVSTTAASFRVSAYRVGWYRGAQARLVWRSGDIRGRRQPGPSFAAATRTVFTRWEPALPVAPAGWPAGAYLIRRDASPGISATSPWSWRRRPAPARPSSCTPRRPGRPT